MRDPIVTVFGGTGFLGRRVVRHLREHGFGVRVASRHADRSHPLLDDVQLRWIQADVHDERSLADALADAYGAVNAVSLYVEHGRETIHSVHVEFAERAGWRRIEHRRANLDHVCLRVEPFDAAGIARHLAGRNVACDAETLRYGAEGEGPSIYLRDPEGNGIELKGAATQR